MCGICGVWSLTGVEPSTLERMNGVIVHRGPDDHGAMLFGEAGLAMRRLSIIDLTHGRQPIANEDSTVWIVFNGEIYNHPQLRAELIARGHRFRTNTDTEVIVHLYEEKGPACVDDLRGMFAFAIWDARARKLLLARDRFGQKPLFWRYAHGRFSFASEIKSLLAGAPDYAAEFDLRSLDEYLTFRFIASPRTMFRDIHKLPPGHLLVLDASALDPRGDPGREPRIEIRPYWRPDFEPKQQVSLAQAVAETRERIRDAVESHMISDAPVGAFLSGGMDSSLVVAMMAEVLRRRGEPPLKTFAIGVEAQDFNELPYARLVAQHCGVEHHEQVASPDMVKLLPRMIWHLDEPSDPIAACMWHSAALAGRHVKVVLTGDGGDEVFAGYDRYFGFRWVQLYAALPEAARRRLIGPLVYALPDRAGYKTFAQKARWVHELSMHEAGRRYAQATAFFRFGQDGKGGLYTDAIEARLAGVEPMEAMVRGFDEALAEDDLDRMLAADMATRLPEHSLMLTDRMTMAQSLEARSPLLDHILAEHAATLPANLKLRGRTLKYVLRKAAEPYLPEEILRRPKQGFMFPLGYWMKGPLLPLLQRLLSRSVLVEEGIFRREPLETLLAEHLAHRADHHVRLWMILNLEIWRRMYVHGEAMEDLSAFLAEPLREEAA